MNVSNVHAQPTRPRTVWWGPFHFSGSAGSIEIEDHFFIKAARVAERGVQPSPIEMQRTSASAHVIFPWRQAAWIAGDGDGSQRCGRLEHITSLTGQQKGEG